MKKYLLILCALALFISIKPVSAQTTPESFTGAKATLKHYNALYVINTADEHHIKGTLRNLSNALEDPRLKGKLQIELIAFGDGVAVYMKSGPFEQILKDLQAKGVILAQCSNTVRERNIDKNTLFPFISYVPSGNGEIIIRQYEGWAVVHP
ncbi:DsrE family protein [Mucilaginibacter segetis]|uniref:DsrE family protein n=1 Tax=Mucilaginibacter segetis TaxID=2793071 RepID=A0A934UMK7_9SPHI|nr:DsrE family protein [Mucilaginibacter segetis]MBK0379763.1 DsrE family protein [Mucilaginibacter segetis]